MFSNVFCFSSILLGVLSTHDHGFHGFRGYIAYSPVRARARGMLAIPVSEARRCRFQGKRRLVVNVSFGTSLGIVFRSIGSEIVIGLASREHIANLRCSYMHEVVTFLFVCFLSEMVFRTSMDATTSGWRYICIEDYVGLPTCPPKRTSFVVTLEWRV